ncbi:MAG: hypothetical protein M1825_003741 [Sarcosagium campestre]|nr:MAG: hypothetical protein M1825_003741 [Sarcosagium campestre]
MVSSPLARPPTTGSPPVQSNNDALSSIPESNGKDQLPPRRSSLGFLRRTKSGEGLSMRSRSGSKGSKKLRKQMQEQDRARREQDAANAPRMPLKLPDLYDGAPSPGIRPFAHDPSRPDSLAIVSGNTGKGGQTPSTHVPSHVPVPPIPGSSPRSAKPEYVDPYARTESMTHRGRYSYASSAISTINSPRRVRRRKDPTPFNVLVIGSRNSGKTSFLNFLRTALALPHKRRGHVKGEDPEPSAPDPASNTETSAFTSQYLETEIDNERIGLTLWDSQGFERNVVDLQLRELSGFLESKFEDTFTEEMKVMRSPGVQDTHIHCVILILDPVRLEANMAAAKRAQASRQNGDATKAQPIGFLDEDLDLQVFRALKGKTVVIPVIGKADTITAAHMAYLKKRVWGSLKQAGINPLEALEIDDTDETFSNRSDEAGDDGIVGGQSDDSSGSGSSLIKQSHAENEPNEIEEGIVAEHGSKARPVERPSNTHRKRLSTLSARSLGASDDEQTAGFPLSIISPDAYDPGTIGRKFPWGFADPYNPEHCDFVKLKDSVFSEWRGELREASREVWYEGWRTSRLRKRGRGLSRTAP